MFGILRNFVRFFTKVPTKKYIIYILKDENWI